MQRRIYLASSWRNPYYHHALIALRDYGHEVYDFRNPAPHLEGFSWTQLNLEKAPADWTPADLLEAHKHPIAQRGFLSDFSAMKWCDTLILLMPAGRSAHIEAGWAVGAGKNVHVILHQDKFEADLMYLM